MLAKIFSPSPGSSLATRQFVREVLAFIGPDVLRPVEQLISELVMGCIHAGTAFLVSLGREGSAVRVEVTDYHPILRPVARCSVDEEDLDRGLAMLRPPRRNGWTDWNEGSRTAWFELPYRCASI